MLHAAPQMLVFVYDPTATPSSRLELGAELRSTLAQNPGHIGSLAVSLATSVIADLGTDPHAVGALERTALDAILTKLRALVDRSSAEDQTVPPTARAAQFDQSAAALAERFQPCLVLAARVAGDNPDGSPHVTFCSKRNVGDDCPANVAVALTAALAVDFEYHLQQVADELGVTTEKLKVVIARMVDSARTDTRDT